MKRAPIVVILGHVDHGKTTLLDRIKKSHLVEDEPGGITQSIGAYRLTIKEKPVTFIDTPGHSAFQAMRRYGAQVADIAVLVVAADDGVMVGTVQALELIRSAAIPFIVAINKIDLPNVDIPRVKTQLVEQGCAVEGFGGSVPVVEISAKRGQHLNDLLDLIQLVWELEDHPIGQANILEAPVIERKKDPRTGMTISVVIRTGNINIGDTLYADGSTARVRAIINDRGLKVMSAAAGDPVQLLGFSDPIPVGTIVTSRQGTSGTRAAKETAGKEAPASLPVARTAASPVALPVYILKADSQGSLEALRVTIPQPSQVVAAGIGEITEADVLLGESTGAIIVGFRSRPTPSAAALAAIHHVDVLTNEVIYKLLEQLESLKEHHPTTEIIGKAKVIKLFHIDHSDIAGCSVTLGRVALGDSVAIETGESIPSEQPEASPAEPLKKVASIRQLKIGKSDVKLVKVGQECGILLDPVNGEKLKLTPGNVIICFKER